MGIAKRNVLVLLAGFFLALTFVPQAWAEDGSLVVQRSFSPISKEVKLAVEDYASEPVAKLMMCSSADDGAQSSKRAVLVSDPADEVANQWQRTGTCEWLIDDAYCLKIRPADGASRGILRGELEGSVAESWSRPWNESAMYILNIEIEGTIELWDGDSPFTGCTNLRSIKNLDNLVTAKRTSMEDMFSSCRLLTELDLTNFDTSNVTNMARMFSGCSSLRSLDVSSFDTSNVTSMAEMFSNCAGVSVLDVKPFATSRVTDMSSMFAGCSGVELLDVASFDTSNVVDMSGLFQGCYELKSLNLTRWSTGRVNNMAGMFSFCHALVSLDLSSFDTRAVTSMNGMFEYCSALESLNLTEFNTENVTDMESMFDSCDRLRALDLSSFDTHKIVDRWGQNLFGSIQGLSKITIGPSFTLQHRLPSPRPYRLYINSEFITINEGADGGWYNKAEMRFMPNEIPLGVADSYYATQQLAVDAANGIEPTFPSEPEQGKRHVTILLKSAHGTTSPAPGTYEVDKGVSYPITFVPDDGYVPYRICVDGVQTYVAPTLSGWMLPASWQDQTFEVEYALAGGGDSDNDNQDGDQSSIVIENIFKIKDIAQLNIYINGKPAGVVPEIEYEGSPVEPAIAVTPKLTSEQMESLDFPSDTSDFAVYQYTLWTIDREHPSVVEIVAFDSKGECLTTNMLAKFQSGKAAEAFVSRVKTDYGSNFLKGSVDGSTAFVRVNMGRSHLDKAGYTHALKNVVDDLKTGPVEGEDYTVAYADNDKPGIATVTIVGKGEYYGVQTVQFTIVGGGPDGNGTGIPGGAQAGTTNRTNTTTPLVQTGASTANGSSSGKTGLVQTGDVVGYSAAGASLLAILAVLIIVGWKRKHVSVAMGPQEKEASFDLANADFETKKKAFYHDKLDKMIPKL